MEYRGIWIEKNPWKYGTGDYQELLAQDNEPEYIIYTPDIEFYCETIEASKRGIDEWIAKNGEVCFYRAKSDHELSKLFDSGVLDCLFNSDDIPF
jgi:hypothetical protein